MKCADSALGGRSYLSVRLPATSACAIIWPPKVRIGFLLGWLPTNVSSSVRFRSSTASSCSKSLTGKTSPLLWLVVVLADPVHVDHVGRAYCARRGAGDDDHQVTTLVAVQGQQRLVDL